MTGRWANLALGALVPLATLSGFLLFVVGSGPVLLVAVLHGGLGLGLLALVPWKHPVVRRGLRRRRAGRTLSVVLTWLLAAALASGLAHLVGLTAAHLPITTMQLHVGAGVVATLLTAVHAVQRPVRVRRADWGRRTLLRSGAVVAAAGVLGLGAEAAGAAVDRSGRRRDTGSVRLGDGEPVPVTQWLFDAVPDVDVSAWRLTVVDQGGESAYAASELNRDDTVRAVLDCTGGWWTELEWSGMRVARLLPRARLGDTVMVTSATGYARRLPLTDDLLLASAVGGQPLSAGHGAPVRLVVPGRRGYHWVKWVVRLEVVDGPWWAQPPLPVR